MRDTINRYSADLDWIYADPDIFRRKAGNAATVGESVADMFSGVSSSLLFTRGNNDILNGITKVNAYLEPRLYHQHPITKEYNAPYLYFSNRCSFIEDEITSYYWATNSSGEREDKPVDRNDHSLDALKYLLSHAPEPATLLATAPDQIPSYMTEWTEIDRQVDAFAHRH